MHAINKIEKADDLQLSFFNAGVNNFAVQSIFEKYSYEELSINLYVVLALF